MPTSFVVTQAAPAGGMMSISDDPQRLKASTPATPPAASKLAPDKPKPPEGVAQHPAEKPKPTHPKSK